MNLDKMTPQVRGVGNPCRQFKAIILQEGTAIPTYKAGSPLMNELDLKGTIPTLVRWGVGIYGLNLPKAFPNKGTIALATISADTAAMFVNMYADGDELGIQCLTGAGLWVDLSGELHISVEVYPT